MITRPQVRNATRDGVMFLNTGGDPRAGIGRFATLTARMLAERGVVSLRFDFPGVGDSADPADGRRHIYEVDRMADIQAAMGLMQAEGVEEMTLAGICAGGYHAMRAVIGDIGVRKALVVSPVKLAWRDGDSLAVAKQDQGRATSFYASCLTRPETWKRLMSGDIDVAAVAKTVSARLLGRLIARRDDTAKALRDQVVAASARGVEIKVLVGVDDASLDEVETYFGPRGAAMDRLPGMSTVVAPGLDHGLARAESRALAMAELIELVDRP
jgi:pimeloyl-ACP methyl ester carboxylesterase